LLNKHPSQPLPTKKGDFSFNHNQGVTMAYYVYAGKNAVNYAKFRTLKQAQNSAKVFRATDKRYTVTIENEQGDTITRHRTHREPPKKRVSNGGFGFLGQGFKQPNWKW
jgi:hypothetical protein